MKVEQIYSLINSVNKQLWGQNALTVTDLSGVISLGETLSLSEDDTDNFLHAIVDKIGKTVVRTLDLELDFPNLYMDSFEFGAILEKININPKDAIANSDYNIANNGFTPTFADISKPDITVKYFKGATTWSYTMTIPYDLFSSAFTSLSKMDSFITAIMSALNDSMVLSVNNMSRMAIDNLIAEKVKGTSGNSNCVINLLKMYNEGTSSDLTVDGAMRSKEFMRYAGMIIRNYIKYMNEPSKLYNMGGMVRATARDNMHVLMLTDFASAYTTYLSSDTFHKELVEMPLYTEVNHWQGSGTDGAGVGFTNNSKISIIPSSEDGEDNPITITQNGVVCVLADRQAVAVGINKRRSGVFRNDIDAYTNHKSSAVIQWFNDTSENAVIFVIDSYDKDEISFDKSTLTFANSSASTQTITATVPSGETVTWKSSKTAVATVSGGVVTPAGAGTCTITGTVTVDGVKYTASCAVTVGS